MDQGNERDEAASDEDDLVRVFRKRKMEEIVVGRCTRWNFSMGSFDVCKFNISLFHFSHDKILENKTVDDRWYYVVCREISFSKLYTRSYIGTYHERIPLKIVKSI